MSPGEPLPGLLELDSRNSCQESGLRRLHPRLGVFCSSLIAEHRRFEALSVCLDTAMPLTYAVAAFPPQGVLPGLILEPRRPCEQR